MEIHDISAGVMERVLDFAYTDRRVQLVVASVRLRNACSLTHQLNRSSGTANAILNSLTMIQTSYQGVNTNYE